jgi:ABC-type lipoprotein export system ATPase subunit
VTLVSVRGLVKNYAGLRPLRLQSLDVRPGQLISILGLDAPAAEVFVGLLTGALLPDEGEIRLFDRSTADVADTAAWLAMLDAVGVITERAVLIEQFSVEQNIAMPFTLEVDPINSEVRPKVEALAREVGIDAAMSGTAVGRAGAEAQTRVRMARALALDPKLLLVEHPSASLPRAAVARVAGDLAGIANARNLAVLTITADVEFARALGGETLMHEPATGALKTQSVWRRWFG